MPKRRRLDRNAQIRQTFAHLCQRQIYLRLDPGSKGLLQVRDARSAVTPDRQAASAALLAQSIVYLVHPDTADFESSRNIAGAIPTFQGPKHPFSQILGIRVHPVPPVVKEE
jgi:hypothetical protein